jgi:inner membrane protein
MAVAFLLTVPLFSIWLLVYDRQTQSREATASITEGWGAEQTVHGPLLVIPYLATSTETVMENGQSVTRSSEVRRELTLAPDVAEFKSDIRPEVRKRSIYEAVVYQTMLAGAERFVLPPDLAASGLDVARLDLARAELRFGLSDPRGLGANPIFTANGRPLKPQPGGGLEGHGFRAPVDAGSLSGGRMNVSFRVDFRGNGSLSLVPDAGDTSWKVHSSWASPSFTGAFLPAARRVDAKGFDAAYRIGNLALGRSLVTLGEATAAPPPAEVSKQAAQISLIQPVDPYSQVNRATKYGFLFIGFTFLALLMFDVIGGVRVSSVEYLLMGVALVLFFVLLLAFAEVIGFTPAYVVASTAIAGLNTAYAAAVLASWRRAGFIGSLLVGLYAVLYVLLSLEAFSLLIGSLMLFAALAGVMYGTRRIDWGARHEASPAG